MANGRTGRSAAKNSLFSSSEEIAERKRKERASFGSKVDEANAKRKAEREAKAAKRKAAMKEAQASRKPKDTSLPQGENRNPKGQTAGNRAKSNRAKAEEGGKSRSRSSANVAGSTAFAGALAKKKEEKKESTKAQPKFGVGKEFTIRGGKANVTKEQLERTGLTQAQYMKQWRASKKRPTAATAKKGTTTSSSTKAPKKVGLLRRVLLGKDGKFGGARGAIDFLPGKSRPKRKEPVNKMGGGMMKSKMASKGGARGGRRPTGMKAGGPAGKFPDLTGDGKVTQADILKGRGVTKRMGGGMMKSKMASKGGAKGGRKPGGMQAGGMMKSKGMAKGGAMKKKGYAMGGPIKKKGMAKGGPVKKKAVSRKPRGVGAALRGYGKAMK